MLLFDRIGRVAQLAIAVGLMTTIQFGWSAPRVHAQVDATPSEQPTADGTPADSTQKPALSVPDRKIREAFLKTKSASTIEDYTLIIDACQEGIDEGATPQGAAYARKLKAWAHNRRGEAVADQGDEQSALKDFDTAAMLDPLLWKAIHNRGVSKAALGDLEGALADFDRVIELNSNYANAWFNRGELKFGQGEFASAVQDYNRAIRLQPGDAGFYNSRGHALYRSGRFREALADYNRAVQLNPNDAQSLVNRGDAQREQGMYGQAANDYRAAIRIDPKLGRAYLSAAWLMVTCPNSRFRNSDMGLEAAQKAIELDGQDDYRYLDTLAAAHANLGQFDEAKDAAMRAVAAAPESAKAKVRQRLQLYERDQAYREGGPPEPVRAATRSSN